MRAITALLLLLMGLSITQAQDTTLTLISHDSFNVSEDVLAAFEEETGITVEILRAGDAGQMVNQAILTKNNPLADVLFGVDNTFLTRALDADLFIPYESPALESVDEAFIVDEDHRVTPVDYGDVCLNYDIAYFDDNDLALPESLQDLTDPAYESLLVVQNPATSSPGLAFMLATVAAFGTDDMTGADEDDDYTYLDYWSALVANDVLISDGWEDAYFGQFTAASEDGTRPLVVSYASSPPVTIDAETGEATTASIVADNTCFRQIEFAGILTGTDQEEAAQQFIDFLLSEAFQEDLPLQMFVFPVNELAELPEDFVEFAQIPDDPATVSLEMIEANRDTWIAAWTETVLR